ncbi:toll/interleukin-1 receptor domain-containing protein [Desulfosarcina sp.]|nr:toll/interleukin-1 receptor domain-containing protein [Desulfosarcina sp.]
MAIWNGLGRRYGVYGETLPWAVVGDPVMANPEHVRIIKQGAKVWNKWREVNEKKIPKLRRANLSNAHLSEANLSKADLSKANLSWVDLSKANLCGTNFKDANLSYANLSKADLKKSYLFKADLLEADLSEANLSGAYLKGANLMMADLNAANLRVANLSLVNLSDVNFGKANFTNATFDSTIFTDVDLSNAIGLDKVKHFGPSSIGIDTIYKSRGKVPEAFLRGCGVPESLINYLKSVTMDSAKYYSCFVSYSHQDKTFAQRLHDQLQARGIRCWLDEKQLLPGDDIYEQVDRGIRMWDKVLLCCSEHSLTSWWVDNEVDTAFEKEQRLQKERGKPVQAIIPLNLDGYLFKDECTYSKAAQLRKRLAADFTGWETDNAKFEEQFKRVVMALQTEGAREEAPASKLA